MRSQRKGGIFRDAQVPSPYRQDSAGKESDSEKYAGLSAKTSEGARAGAMVDFPASIIAACEVRVLGVEKKLISNLGNFELLRNLGVSKKSKLAEQMELANFASVSHLQRIPKEVDLMFLRSKHLEPAGQGLQRP